MKRVQEFTPDVQLTGDPSWNPWTAMRTVSPTWALLGMVISLGPLGAAEEPTGEQQQNNMRRLRLAFSCTASTLKFQ